MKVYIQFIYIQQIFLILYDGINGYKLNVPKILLPFYSSKITNFTLEVKHDLESGIGDICFVWSSSRPDLVSITPIYEDRHEKFNGHDCSHRAIVSALSKHSQRMTSIIFAKEITTDKMIRCDVIVDKIHSIEIKHTTTHLYLEDSPESLTVTALDFEMNTFTSIDGLAFEWKILNDETASEDSRNVLKISNFLNSEYEASDSIKQLESLGLHGHKILIEGLKTGSASIQAKLIDPFYKNTLKTAPFRLIVVANILIEPSYPIYLLKGTSIRYNVYLIKQTSVEKIVLPSSQYYFESENRMIADFDQTGSLLQSNELGSTQLFFVDRNMHEKFLRHQQIGLRPPSTLVHVVQAGYFKFFLKNWRSWIIETGREYQIEIQLYTQDNNVIYPSDNLRIESEFDKVLSVREKSQNGSYVLVKALHKSVSVIKAFLPDGRVRGEQQIEIFDPISTFPKNFLFAFSPNMHQYYHQLINVYGGSGAYFFQLKDTLTSKLDATIDSNGLLKVSANRLGQSIILVSDQRNFDIKSESKVMVIEPASVVLEACPVETLVKSKLEIKIRMNGLMSNGVLEPLTHCSKLNFTILFQDETIFKLVTVSEGDGTESCAVIALEALKIGKTILQVVYGEIKSQEMIIYSLSALTSHKKSLLLTKSSSYLINLSDGPFLNGDMHSYLSEYKIKLNSNFLNVEHVEHDSLAAKYTYRITCLDSSSMDGEVEFYAWNKPSNQNKCPIKLSFSLMVKCSIPKSLDLYQLFVKNEDSDQQVYSGLKWNCPIKSRSKMAVANVQRDLYVQLLVRDENGREFDNFTSLIAEWKLDSHFLKSSNEEIKFLNVRPINDNKLVLDSNAANFFTLFYQRFLTKKELGSTRIEFKLYTDNFHYLHNILNIRFDNDVEIEPKKLVLFNHPFYMRKLNLVHGSGYFHAQVESADKNLLKINSVWDSGLEVSPLTNNGICYLNVFDYCMPHKDIDPLHNELFWKPAATSSVTIVAINSILVNYEDDKVQEGQQIKIFVQIVDANGNYIESDYFRLMNLEAKVVDSDLSLFKIEPLAGQTVESQTTMVFVLTGFKSGLINVRFEARSDSETIKSHYKSIEIYAPIRVEPKLVELILATEYQIRYTGGPMLAHDMNIKFEILDNSELVEINQNGLVKALELGTCRVRVQFNNSIKLYTQDLVEFKIVDLKFVKIHSPLASIKSGNKFPLHLLANNLSPFYFGTSKLIQYKWTLNDVTLAEIIRNDDFSIHVRTIRAGLLKIFVTVLYGNREFTDSTEVNVFLPAYFSNLRSVPSSDNVILASPLVSMQFRTNYDLISPKIVYELEFGIKENDDCSSSNIQISTQGFLNVSILKPECYFGLKCSIYLDSKLQIIYYSVKIKDVSYRMLNLDGQKISVSYHDNLGDEFYVMNTKNSLLTNRNDLINIYFQNQNIFGTGDRISFLSSSKENSFQMAKLKDGLLIMQIQSDNYNDYVGFETKFLSQRVQEIYVGDLILNFTEPSSSIIKSVKTKCHSCTTDSYIGVAFEPGSITLDNNKEYLVRNLDKVYFLNENVILSNAKNFENSQNEINHVEFTANPEKLNEKSSEIIEFALTQDLNPFECTAKFLSENDEHLGYLDAIMTTKVVYRNNNWACAISFSPNSDSELYELILSYLQKTGLSSYQSIYEPDKIEVSIKLKNTFPKNIKATSHVFKFVPAFFVKEKILELPLSGYSHMNLIVKLTSFSKSKLIVSTNVPSLVDIKLINRNDFTEIYDIEKKVSVLNLDELVKILQINNGNLYIQINDPLTHQLEQIAIKFDSKNIQMSESYSKRCGFFDSTRKSIFSQNKFNFVNDINLITLFLIFLLILFTCFYVYHKSNLFSLPQATPVFKTPQSPVRSPSSSKGFNPYLNFSPTINLSNRSIDTDQTAPEPNLFSTNTNESYLFHRTRSKN